MKRCYGEQTHLRKKIRVEDQRAQEDNRCLRGRQIASLTYEYFRPTGSFDEIQGLLGLSSIKMENDDIQDFDLRWEQALLLISDPPSDKVLAGPYVSKLQESFQAHKITALHNQAIFTGGGQRDDHRLRMCVKLHFEQTQRSKNFRIQNEITEHGAVTKERDKILPPSGRQENAFSGESLGLAQGKNVAVLYISLPRETERICGKKWRMQEDLALNQLMSE